MQQLTADYSAGTGQVFGEIGHMLDMGEVRLQPFGQAALVYNHMDGFSESGGAAALTMASSVQANLFATIGLRGSTEFVLEDDMTLTLRGGLGWRHRFGDDASILFVYKSVPQGAATSVWAGVVADAAEVGGRYCENCHVATVTEAELRSDAEGVRPYALDAERTKALWAKSEEMVGQRFP